MGLGGAACPYTENIVPKGCYLGRFRLNHEVMICYLISQ